MQSQVMGQTWKGSAGNGEKTCGGYVHKMELTELSLAPTQAAVLEKSRNSSSSSSESENTPSRKRKLFYDPFQLLENGAVPVQASVDLHARSPLPLDWEQCLDLESGKMYYLNRKTLRKSWSWPKNQKLDLELNMSTIPNCPDQWNSSRMSSPEESDNKNHASSNSNMVALACSNCHLLVILSKSSPSCPNCKYLHSFPPPIATEKGLPHQVPEHSTPPELMASARDRSAQILYYFSQKS